MHFNPDYDTHSFIKKLTSKKFAEEQAEAIVDVVKEVLFANNLKVEKIEKEVLSKPDTRTIQEQTKLIVDEKFERVKNELATKEDLRNEMKTVKEDLVKLEIKISDSKAEMLKWMFGMFLAFSSAQIGLIIFILKAFFKGATGV